MNVSTVQTAVIHTVDVTSIINTTIQSLNIGNIIAQSAQAAITTFSLTTPLGIITVLDSNSPNLSSLSSIVSYGLSTVAAADRAGVSSLSSVVSYGLSSVRDFLGVNLSTLSTSYARQFTTQNASIGSLSTGLLSTGSLTTSSITLIDTYTQAQTPVYSASNILYYGNNVVYGLLQYRPQFITF